MFTCDCPTGFYGYNCDSKFSVILYNAKDVIVTCRKTLFQLILELRYIIFPVTFILLLKSHLKYGLLICQLKDTDEWRYVSYSEMVALFPRKRKLGGGHDLELISLWTPILSHPDALTFRGYFITSCKLISVTWNKCNS